MYMYNDEMYMYNYVVLIYIFYKKSTVGKLIPISDKFNYITFCWNLEN